MIAVVLGLAGAGAAGVGALRVRRLARSRPVVTHDPLVAWHRGLASAGAVLAVAALSGTLGWALDAAWLPESDAGTSSGVGLVMVVSFLYGGVWARGTDVFGREQATRWSVAFGMVWGVSAATAVLVAWHAAGWVADGLARVGVAFLVASAWQGIWHARYWDRRVSPEHNLPRWNLVKVVAVHTPNLVLSLLYLDRERALLPVVVAQVVAIVLSAVAMRFPAPHSPPVGLPAATSSSSTPHAPKEIP